jgi:Flp pilus assembly protein TadD
VRVSATPFGSEAQLEAIDAMIRKAPDAIALHFARACCLEDLGRIAAAQRAYLDVLADDANHFGALTNLGSLLLERDDREVARAFFTKAAVHYPDDAMAQANLAGALAADGDLSGARERYGAALAIDPGHLVAHLGLAGLAAHAGDPAGAEQHRAAAFAAPRVWRAPYFGAAAPLQLLFLISADGGNVVTNFFVDNRVVAATTLVAETYRPELALPPHHVCFNAIGDADRCRAPLEVAAAIAARSGGTIVNDPARVLETGRAAIAARLAAIPGVRVAHTELLPRAAITVAELRARGFAFPLLLRSPGYHTGRFFEPVMQFEQLAQVVATLPGDELFVIAYLNARGPDGNARKYRVVFVDGRPYPVHLAISSHWKIHYFSADMHRPEHRAEEQAFLDDMPAALGSGVMRALEAVNGALGLDYAGIDFGLDAQGNVLVFESNATMAVYPPAPDDRWNYRRSAAERVFAGVRAMIAAKAERAGYRP